MKQIDTKWELLTSPYICGLLAENPSQFSQTLHNSGFQELNLPFTYYPFKIFSLENAITAMKELRIRGFSITIPFKESCIEYIDKLDSDAKEIGAVNTIINSGEMLYGINTDWIGVLEALKESITNFSDISSLIIGAGGASKAAVFALKKLNVPDITLVNRTDEKAKSLADSHSINYVSSSMLTSEVFGKFNLIINASPAKEISFFPYEALNTRHIVFEMITGETKLTKATEKVGGKVIPGIRMLLHQGLKQFELFTESVPPANAIETALENKYFINS